MTGGTSPYEGNGLVSAATFDGGVSASDSQTVSGEMAGMSHLDSVFQNSGWTREDVLLVVGVIQVAAWVALLYLEVQK